MCEELEDWTAFGYYVGDIVVDYSINVTDIIKQINFILVQEIPSEYEFWASDLNIDLDINVIDVVGLTNYILGNSRISNIRADAYILNNKLFTSGSIGAIQVEGELISEIYGTDIEMTYNNRTVIFNLNGALDTKEFTFKSTPAGVIVSSSTAENVPLTQIAPDNFKLKNAYPNPFNPSTTISYSINNYEYVNVAIYNMGGQLVAELINSNQSAGNYSIVWHASNQPSGIYFVKLSVGNQIATQKILLVK